MITIDDFIKIELKVGTVLEAEEIIESEKLIKMQVDLGEDPSTSSGRDIRQILAGIKKWYTPAKLIGKQFIFVANLEPRMIRGYESQGMIFAMSSVDGKFSLISPDEDMPVGTKAR